MVVLLDPARPDHVPLAALPHLSGDIEIDADVPEAVCAHLPAPTPGATVLVMMDVAGPALDSARASGAQLIRSQPVLGHRLAEAATLMDRLWSRGGWEQTQTHESLSEYLVEETYEVLDAIRSGDESNLREELGDLLLQVLFHARIAQAGARFDVDDVAGALIEKLIGRSPHLSSSGVVDIAEQERVWEQLKAAEKARGSSMDGIALSQPPILLAEKVVRRAVKAGLADIADTAVLAVLIEDCLAADAALAEAVGVLMANIRDYEGAGSRIDDFRPI